MVSLLSDGQVSGPCGTHILSIREDRTTETDEAAIAAEPIQGWSTRPRGMNTPATIRGESIFTLPLRTSVVLVQ